ncbi:MAG: hypothetical protein WD467_01905 [Candidatus Saccharimonadales bacterium]
MSIERFRQKQLSSKEASEALDETDDNQSEAEHLDIFQEAIMQALPASVTVHFLADGTRVFEIETNPPGTMLPVDHETD